MNSAKLNTIAGAVLFVLLVTMGLGMLSDIIFAPSEPEKPGYEIVVAEAGSEGEAEEENERVEKARNVTPDETTSTESATAETTDRNKV